MSEFSVGDRVEVISIASSAEPCYKVGDILTVHKVDSGGDPIFECNSDMGAGWACCEYELISKGGQNEMENLEAIAVVGDDDLKEKLIDISYGNGWEHILGGDVPVTTTVVFYLENKSVANSNKRSYKEIGLKPSSRFGKISEGKREVLELPQDWEKAKKFVTQDFEESLELAGEEVEVDGKEFSIGCYNGHLDDLQNLVDGLHGLGVNEVEITEQGHSVDIDDLIELREFVEGKQ